MGLVSGPNTGTSSSHSTKKMDAWSQSGPSSFAPRSDACTIGCLDELFIVFRLQCGVGDACFISACAPISNERTQTSTTEALRIEFWRKPNGVIRQVPNRCRVIFCMDANGEVDTTLPWIGCAGSRICDQRKMWTHIGHELLEMLRSNQLVAISTHGEANRQCWT